MFLHEKGLVAMFSNCRVTIFLAVSAGEKFETFWDDALQQWRYQGRQDGSVPARLPGQWRHSAQCLSHPNCRLIGDTITRECMWLPSMRDFE